MKKNNHSIPKQIVWLLFLFVFTHAQPPRPSPPQNEYSYGNFKLSTALVMLVLICAFFSMGIFTVLLRSCAEVSSTSPRPPYIGGADRSRRRGLKPDVIESFPVFVYGDVKDLKIGKGALECAVCLCEFEDDDMLRLLTKCDHVFHPDCIDAWLACHVTCPVCRANLSPDSENTKTKTTTTTTTNESAIETGTQTPELAQPNLGNVTESSSQEQNQTVIDIETRDRVQNNSSIQQAYILETPKPCPCQMVLSKFPRSHSTGHSLVQPGECTERYTLRLPVEVRNQYAVSTGKLKRTRSYDVISRKGEGSSRGGWRSWVASVASPIVSRRFGGDGSSRGKTLFRRPAV